MKNNFSFYLFTLVFLFSVKTFLLADELEINSSKIKFDKKTKITILEGNVSAIDSKNNKIFGITHHGNIALELTYLNQPAIGWINGPWGPHYQFLKTWRE
mgnify:CR=1 FL=1